MPRPKKIRLSVSVCRSVQRAPVQSQTATTLSQWHPPEIVYRAANMVSYHDRAMSEISVSLYFYTSRAIQKE